MTDAGRLALNSTRSTPTPTPSSGAEVAAFEREFAAFVNARYAIAAANGTVTLQAALVALGVGNGDLVAVPPLTMAATTIAVLNAGGRPVFGDVNPDTWLLDGACDTSELKAVIRVSLYGHHGHWGRRVIDDAAQALRPHTQPRAGKPPFTFTSYSFQASKILALGEGGMLVTNDEALASRAREYLSLGYRMRADQPRIDPAALKSPTFDRHYSLGINGRMNDITAREGLRVLPTASFLLLQRKACAQLYHEAIQGCDWLTPQHVPHGTSHDYWCYAVACDTPERAIRFAEAIAKHGAERPFPAWRLTFDEPAFRHLDPGPDACPVARSLQPRILQAQTNDLASAETNAVAWRKAIAECSY